MEGCYGSAARGLPSSFYIRHDASAGSLLLMHRPEKHLALVM